MLQPARQKYRKQFRGKMRGVSQSGNMVAFGDYGLKSLESSWVSTAQIEACRVALSRRTRKGGKFWVRIFPDKPITQKPNETGLGGGKGDILTYVAVVKPGRIMFEMGGLPYEMVKEAFDQAAHKLPIKTSVVSKK
jgi:large subunit ribosomal protein L16